MVVHYSPLIAYFPYLPHSTRFKRKRYSLILVVVLDQKELLEMDRRLYLSLSNGGQVREVFLFL